MAEQGAEQRLSHPNGQQERCPQSGGDKQARKCLTSILTQQGRNVTADHIKLMLQLPDPNDRGLQESLLFHQSTVDQLVVLAAVELLVLDKD